MKKFDFAKNLYWVFVTTFAFVTSLSRMTWMLPAIPSAVGVSVLSTICLIGILGNWIASTTNSRFKISDRRLFWPYVALVFWALLSIFWSINVPASIGQLVLFICVSGFSFTTYLWRWNSQKQIRQDLTWIFFLISFVSIIGLVFAVLKVQAVFGDYGRLYGVFLNPGVTGTIAALSVPLGIFLISEVSGVLLFYAAIGTACGIATSLASGTKGALLAMIFALVVAVYKLSRHRLAVSLLSALSGILIWLPFFTGILGPNKFPVVQTPVPNSQVLDLLQSSETAFSRLPSSDLTSGRIEIYKKALSVASENLTIGHGFRTTKLLPQFNGIEAHNTYLGILLELGLVGLVIFGWFLFQMFKSGGPSLLVALPIFFIVKEASDSMFLGSGGPVALIYWICLLAYSRWGEIADDKYSLRDWLKPGQPATLL